MTELQKKIFSVFNARKDEFELNKKRLVHYTSANNAFNILKGNEFWLGSVMDMPDSSEMVWGYDLVKTGFMRLNEKGNNIFKVLLGDEYHQFLYWLFNLQTTLYETYVLSFIEHSKEETSTGILPMWRNYGGESCPVALNFNILGLDLNNGLPYLTSVEYFEKSEFEDKFLEMVGLFELNIDELKTEIDKLAKLKHRVIAAIVSLKHPSYSSEKEWRIIVNPSLYDFDGIEHGFNEQGAYPKQIYKLKLNQDIDNQGTTALDLLESITIGPYSQQSNIANCFKKLIKDVGIEKCEIKYSDLPERL